MDALIRIIRFVITSLVVFSTAQAKQAIIIDTDLAKDDWAAIAYLMNSPEVDIRAITIEGSGESDCVDGLFNLSVALQQWGKQDIPIACDKSLGIYKTQFPTLWLNPGTRYFHQVYIARPSPPKIYASPAKLIINVLKNSNEKITIVAIGPYINLKKALHLDRKLMLDKVNVIYVSGGDFSHELNQTLSYYPDLNKEVRSWNFFITPEAAHELFSQPFKFVLNSAQINEQLNNSSLYNLFKLNQKKLNQYGRLVALLETQGDAPFWGDVLTAVMMLHPHICQYKHVKIEVLYKDYRSAGVSIISSKGQKVSYCSKFTYKELVKVFMQRMLQ